MTHNFLEELEIPQPPYRMARPMATLTASDEPPKPTVEAPPPHRADTLSDEALRKEFEAALPDIEKKLDTLEAVDASVTEAKDGAEKRIDAVPTPDVAAKDAAKAEVEEVESWYKGKANEGGRTVEEASQEFKGEGRPLNSIQEEYESTEAALKRAETAGNQKEVERLTKQAQEYSDVIEKQTTETPPVESDAARKARLETEEHQAFIKAGKEFDEAIEQAEAARVAANARLRAELNPENIEAAKAALEAVEKLKGDKIAAAKESEERMIRGFDGVAQNPEVVAAKPHSPDETLPPTPITEVAPAAPEVGSETINVKPGEPIRTVREALGAEKPAEAPLSEGELRQQKFDAKSPVEKKKQVTRDQTAALKENAAREAAEQATPETPPAPSAAESAPAAPEMEPPPPPREGLPSTPEAPRVVRPLESGYLSSAVEWASKKTGAGAWLDTLLPRLKSVYHRQFAERRAWMQEKAQGSLDRAVSKQEEFAAKRADASWPLKKYYAWRERVWAKSVAKREAIVNKHDLYRTRRIDRHNELQRQVSGRYERELAPYRGVKESLEREQRTVTQVIATLEERYQTALAALEAAEGKRSGLFGRRGKAAADRIRRCAKEIEQRITEQRKNLDRVNKPLANASMKIEKYEAKQRGVAEVMKFPEMEGLKTARRARPGRLPGRRAFNTYTTEAAPGSSVEAGDRTAEEWTPGDFVREWNGNGLVRIDDTAAFEKYITDQRAAAGESGPVRLGRMLELTEGYLTSIGAARGFARDRRFFLNNIRKTSTP